MKGGIKMSKDHKGLTRREFMELGLAGAAGLALGGPSVLAATPKRGGTLTCGMAFLIQYPDPHQYAGTWAHQAKALAWEGLFTPTSVGERIRITREKGPEAVQGVQPMLADAYEIEKGGTRYIFHLKKGVKFHNGKELDSADVKWSWARIADPRTRGPRKTVTQFLKNSETPDKYTIVANLSQPYASFLVANHWGLAPILPKDSVPPGVRWGQTPTFKPKTVAPPGTGPFKMVKFQQKYEAHYEAFKDYRIPGIPYLDKVIYKVISKDQPRTMAVRTGEVDYIWGAEVNWVSEALKDKQYELHKTVTLEKEKLVLFPILNRFTIAIYLNHHDKRDTPFKDIRVRQALDYCIDREQITRTMWGTLGVPMGQFFHPDVSYWAFPDIKPKEANIEKAKRLLKEAGYPNGLDVEFLITPTWGKNDKMAQIVQQMARPAGFRISINPKVGMQYYLNLRKYSYQMFLYGFGGLEPMIGGGYGAFHTDPIKPYNGYSPSLGLKDEVMDKLFDEAISGADNKKRKEAYRKVMERINENSHVLPLYTTIVTNTWSTKIKNFKPWNYYYPEQAFKEVWLEG
jgi:ABC-type transport system substrate-binding protein